LNYHKVVKKTIIKNTVAEQKNMLTLGSHQN
jgi:hypothetical protein